MKSLVIKDQRGLNFKTIIPEGRYTKGKTVCFEAHTTLQPRMLMQEMNRHIIKGFAGINIHKSSRLVMFDPLRFWVLSLLCDPLNRVELRNMRQLKVRYELKVDTLPQACWLSSQTSSDRPMAVLAFEKLEGLLHTFCSSLLFVPAVWQTQRPQSKQRWVWNGIQLLGSPHLKKRYISVMQEGEKSWQCALEWFTIVTAFLSSRPKSLNGRTLLH